VRKTAIIVAGGKGTRMGGDTPKQFLELGDKPVIYHSMAAFINYDHHIRLLVGIPEGFMEEWMNICKVYSIDFSHEIVAGGTTRFHTVLNALARIEEDELVAVHDAVRPFVSKDTIKRCFDMAEKRGTAVPCIDIPDSIRETSKDISHPVRRELFKMIQTPQVFKGQTIKAAYLQEYRPGFTDDASVVEQAGYAIHLVKGNRENFKITTYEDYLMARAYHGGLTER
jgi:2-C-methyl-D-erythritol 4-phosphate cytidylyltransferase